MYIKIILLICCISFKNVQAQKQFINDPDAELRSITESFSAIKVSGSINVYISQADEQAVAISAAKDEYKDAIKTIVKNGELNIYFDYGQGSRRSYKNKKINVYLACKNIHMLQASASSNIYVAGHIVSPHFILSLSGSSKFKGGIKADKLVINLSGASDAAIQGSVSEGNIDVSGASDVLAFDLMVEKCTINTSGASDVQITVNKELNVNTSGASHVSYKGNGVIKQIQSSGSSSVIKK